MTEEHPTDDEEQPIETDGGRRLGKLERVRERLGDIGPRTRDSIHDTFERASGEVWVRHDGAPDRNDYASYEAYLRDAHEWTVEQLQTDMEKLRSVVEQIDTLASEYPELGDDRRRGNRHRKSLDNEIANLIDAVERLDEMDRLAGRLEESYREN